ncbi:MAG: DUF1772 domain-containing protein [Rhodospirillales bacterium]|nr:DUF1772 domain-containing protein [Acetobacter sp.]
MLTLLCVGLTLLLCGGYAGMISMCQIGVLPAMRRLQPSAYAEAWRAMDLYMDRAMPPYKGALLLVNVLTVILLVVQHFSALAMAAGVSLLFSILGLLLTVRGQLPLNAKLKTLPAEVPEAVLLDIRDRTIRGFSVRCVLAILAFLVLCLGVVLWPVRFI